MTVPEFLHLMPSGVLHIIRLAMLTSPRAPSYERLYITTLVIDELRRR